MKLNEYRRKLAAPPEKKPGGARVFPRSLVDFIKETMPGVDTKLVQTFTGIDWAKTKFGSVSTKTFKVPLLPEGVKITPLEGKEGTFLLVDDVASFKEAAVDRDKIAEWYKSVIDKVGV